MPRFVNFQNLVALVHRGLCTEDCVPRIVYHIPPSLHTLILTKFCMKPLGYSLNPCHSRTHSIGKTGFRLPTNGNVCWSAQCRRLQVFSQFLHNSSFRFSKGDEFKRFQSQKGPNRSRILHNGVGRNTQQELLQPTHSFRQEIGLEWYVLEI